MLIELVYALPEQQTLLSFEVAEGTTVNGGIKQSGIQEHYPELDIQTIPVGIFGKQVDRDTVLRERDRIELYRPLLVDPREARRQRADAERDEAQARKKRSKQ